MSDIKAGDKVKLTEHYVSNLKREPKKAFSGELIVLASEGGKVFLSNGKQHGLCKHTCSEKHVRKIS